MKKSDLIEAWLNSEVSEDEAILILERMKHDDSFTKEIVDLSEIHACLYTIYHEENSFDELKLNPESLSPDEMEDQIIQMISEGNAKKEKEKKKRITVIDLPQNVTVKTKSFEQPKNYWPLVAGLAAVLTIIFMIVALTGKKSQEPVAEHKDRTDTRGENISLVQDKQKKNFKKPVINIPKKEIDENQQPAEIVKVQKDKPAKKVEEGALNGTEPMKIAEKEKTPLPPVNNKNIPSKVESLGLLVDSSEYSVITRGKETFDAVKDFKLQNGDELSTSYEAKAKIRLMDESFIDVDLNSTLKFIDGKVVVINGRADFHVSKQDSGQFQVVSGTTLTSVVGTRFSVKYLNKISTVKVNEGIVKVKSKDREVILKKEQMSISKDESAPLKHDISEQFGIVAGKWTMDQIGPQVNFLEYDVTDFITDKGYYDFYFKKQNDDSKGMLQVFKVELYEGEKLIAVDEHNGVTSNHTTDLRNRNIWLHGGYGSGMYRFYLKKLNSDNKYTVKVRCRSFKGSCDGEVWLLHTQPDSTTLQPGVLPQGTNLAYRKKVMTEKEGFSKNHGPEKVVDNKINPESSWWGAGSKWVQIDLGKVYDVNSMFIANFWEQNCYHQYFVEVSKDGENWAEVINMRENTLPAHESGQFHRFAATEARYVRMTVDSVHFSQGGISVVEIKVYNSN